MTLWLAFITARAFRRSVKDRLALQRRLAKRTRFERVLDHHLDRVTTAQAAEIRLGLAVLNVEINEKIEDMRLDDEIMRAALAVWQARYRQIVDASCSGYPSLQPI